MDDRERKVVEEEIRNLEAELAEYRKMYPNDWMQIKALENQIEGKKAYLRGW
jgi:hypothetical protein